MKKALLFVSILALTICLIGCGTAYDGSTHTARFYFYNYTDEPYFAKLIPDNVKSHEKFRIHTTDYIQPKTDDSVVTEPEFSFEWIPGEFYLYTYPNEKSQDYDAHLEFYKSKREKIKTENEIFPEIPSAQDYEASFFLIQTFTKAEMSEQEMNDSLAAITDDSDKAAFSSMYVMAYVPENLEKPYLRDECTASPIVYKNRLRQAENIIERYGLEKGPKSYLFAKEATKGELTYEYRTNN